MQNVITWVVEHGTVLAALGVAVLDLVFAVNQKAESNGILHWISIKLKSLVGK